MSGGKAQQQRLHIRRLGDRHICWVDPIWLHHHCRWEEDEVGVPFQDEYLPVLQGGLCKEQGHKLREMCGSGGLRHTTSGGLSPVVKVASLLIRDQGVLLAPSSSSVKTLGNPTMLGSGAGAATPAMVFQVCCTFARVRAI